MGSCGRVGAHSGSFDEFYYHFKFAYDQKTHQIMAFYLLTSLASFDEFYAIRKNSSNHVMAEYNIKEKFTPFV